MEAVIKLEDGKKVAIANITSSDAKMIKTALYHQWIQMTDDNGEAVNCKQESVDTIYRLLKQFEDICLNMPNEE